MSYEFFIATRYLRSKRKTGFISLITYISIFGVVVGVAALIIILSVMNGFEREVRSRFIGVDAHIQIRQTDAVGFGNYEEIIRRLQKVPHIRALAPFVQDKALIKSREATTGLFVKGVLPELEMQVTDIGKNLNFGQFNLGLVKGEDDRELPGIVLGFNLADKLVVTIGDVVTIVSFSGMDRLGQMPQMMQFRVTGYFETGLFEYDDSYAYISLKSAQKLFQMGEKVSGIEIRVDNYNRATSLAKDINKLLGAPYKAVSWFDMNPNLFAWMQIEKWAAFVILSLIILVAAFNIVSTLIMVTMEKTREIGILKSMGATSQSIRRIFTFEGLVVGVVGTILGCLIGYGFCWAQITYKFFALPSDIYIISWLPVVMKWTDFVFIGLAGIIITFLASVYPAAKAARLDPVVAIRYE